MNISILLGINIQELEHRIVLDNFVWKEYYFLIV